MRLVLFENISSLFESQSTNEDTARREFILNVLLIGSISIFGIAISYNAFEQLLGASNSMSLWTLQSMLGFFGILYAVSRSGGSRVVSILFIGVILLFAAHLGFRWGVDLPAGILLYVLAITMSGVLISTRAAFLTTLIVIAYLWIVGGMQADGLVGVDRSWASIGWHTPEVIIAGSILLVIATVSWLGNREIEKSLTRARQSEQDLRTERDNLEIRVAERTEELRRLELDRMSQTYRFVEFGRLAGSIFHDLSNPLTALSLNIESMAREVHSPQRVATFTEDIGRAQNAASHMQKLMMSMRRHLAHEGQLELFQVSRVLSEVVQVLIPYARSRAVSLRYSSNSSIKLHGDSVAFLQIITNIVSNGIDSHPESEGDDSENNRWVSIGLRQEGGEIILSIADNGSGVPEEMVERIFEPFFSTKIEAGGMGIGLSLAKRLLERRFDGRVEVVSRVGKGTTFTLYFPQHTSNVT